MILSSPRGAITRTSAVESHDGLLPDNLLGVGEEVDDLGQNDRDGLVIDELANGIEGGADDKVIVRATVLLDGVDDEDNEVVIVGEEESDGEIAGALEEEIVVVGHLDGVDVGKGGVVAKHLDVDEADEVLFHLALGDVKLAETAFEGFHLLKNDAVLCDVHGHRCYHHEAVKIVLHRRLLPNGNNCWQADKSRSYKKFSHRIV